MDRIASYKDLIVWQKSVELVSKVYEITRLFPEEEKFGLTSQIRRSAVSIPSNIAEGYGRGTSKTYLQFLSIARGSLFELETQFHIARRLRFITENNEIEYIISEISKMLNALINKIKN
ncbi:four helix bundle protein [Capnocytophaga canimorsus]|uniref:four helix bundle protein n=1 Tax=Capnocytophaga canimorsus TaxID=28188 RepID=UPI001EDFFBEA|nr:four helix bundle protein [Capnocytophaga canimorsus]GJQ05041.1 four helix bundle protein [Capnocytophaga canimorsus]